LSYFSNKAWMPCVRCNVSRIFFFSFRTFSVLLRTTSSASARTCELNCMPACLRLPKVPGVFFAARVFMKNRALC
jgi:hypothetical protein